ncbi:hypothetical protein Asppvi_009805 [Aspergillus pseudoviridinutans]|uniref:Mitochondrial division protein 1 n=1 Tax=Aspergillus pseudoviridinutans TaxID=1517512 RepID=A0A9P3BGG4_9EURO|nr:uncharacterized protein Asppvi_009805 [Aspergillus pseudoviridinutans]GIJ90841.1 hypothetical protein Asppvi_009805 [Aspergillus pseudoviridinutans]
MPNRARRILASLLAPTGKVDQHSSGNVIRNKATILEPEGESKTLLVSEAAAETSSPGDPDPDPDAKEVKAAKGQDTIGSATLTGLWDEAYKLVEEENADLLAAYERYLLLDPHSQSTTADEPTAELSISSRERQEEIRKLAQRKLNAVQQGHLKVIIKGKEIVIRDQIHRILLTNPVTQTDSATELIAYVSDLMVRCRVIEETLNLPSLDSVKRNGDIRTRLRTKSVRLYVQIIKSQMLVTCHYSRAAFLRFWRDVANVDDWKQMLDDMLKAKQNIDEDLQALGQSLLGHVDAEVSKLQEKADNMIRMLGDISQGLNIAKLPCAKYAGFNALDPTARLSPTMCHEKTRVEILDEIVQWGRGDEGRCIFWLSGMAGTGKSTVIRTAAERFHRQGLMGASFFFSRTGELRNQTTALFTTLASQLADSLPELRSYMSKAIDQDKSIGEQSPRNQWERLILEPLLELDKTLLLPLHAVFAIDALDECRDHRQQAIPELFAQAKRLKMIRLRVLITSRPEKTIAESFRKMPRDLYHVSQLDSDEQTSQTTRDISIFLKSQLAVVADANGLESGWPGEKQIQILVQRAGRLFIYAATACRFLDSNFPEERLATLLDAQATDDSPTADLDEVYHLALRQAISESPDSKYLVPLFRRIVGSIILLEERLCPKDLSVLLNIPLRQVRIILDLLRSVLAVPDEDTSPVALFHLSFHDFLLDRTRCPDPQICIEEQSAHSYLLDRCLELMSQHLTKDMCHLRRPGTLISEMDSQIVEKYIPYALQYTCRFWVTHLANADVDLKKDERVYAFLATHLLHWLETLSLIRKIFEGIATINLLEDLVKAVANPSLRAFIYDTKRFVLCMRSSIEAAPLQIYCGLVFTPRRSVLREIFQRDIPAWFERLPRVEGNWSPLEQTLQHPLWVGRVAVSPSGSLLAVACAGRGSFLWNTATGQLIMDNGHGDDVVNLAFVDDGSKLAEACSNGAVRLWDTSTGQMLRAFGHSSRIESAAFSFGSPALACTADGPNIRVENLDTGETEDILELGADVRCVAISRSGFQIAASTNESIVCFRDTGAAATQRAVQYQQSSSCRAFSALALEFSSDGSKLAVGHYDGCVVLWDLTGNGMINKELSPRHARRITQLAFAPDDTKLLSSSEDATVRVWDVASGETEQILQGHSDAVDGVAFFPDGRRVASGSMDWTARVWNIALEQEKRTSTQTAVRHVLGMAICLETSMVAAGFNNGSLEVWDVEAGKMQQQLLEPQGYPLKAMAFSPDGTMLAAGNDYGEITLWSTADGKQRKGFRADREAVEILAFSHDGRMVASASIEATQGSFNNSLIKIWDINQGKLKETLLHPDEVRSMAFSPDDQKLACATDDQKLRIWDLSTWKNEVAFDAECPPGNPRAVPDSLRFSPDSTVLAAGYRAEIMFFQVATGRLIHRLSGHYSSVGSVIFSNERIELAVAYCIEWNGWIRRNGERILYLPIDYRPDEVCIQGDIVILGTYNHGIVTLGFSPDNDTVIRV